MQFDGVLIRTKVTIKDADPHGICQAVSGLGYQGKHFGSVCI
jgi:hypothetical protein